MSIQQVRLRWNNHISILLKAFADQFEREQHVDVTILCQGQSIKAHKIVLNAHSTIMRKLLDTHPATHPVIIFTNIKFEDLRCLLEIMYKGQAIVAENRIHSLLDAANYLQIEGLHKVQQKQKVPKPQNAFMIFSNKWRKELFTMFPHESNNEISKKLGYIWNNIPAHEKRKYFEAADLAVKEHAKKYPDYYYNPNKASKRKRCE